MNHAVIHVVSTHLQMID